MEQGRVDGISTATPAGSGLSSLAGRGLILAGVLVVAFNLRTTINVVGPLVPIIRGDLGTSNVGLGLIGTIPVLAFGVVSPVAAALGTPIRHRPDVGGVAGPAGRGDRGASLGGFGWLVAGTIGLGVAIAIGNVLCPR